MEGSIPFALITESDDLDDDPPDEEDEENFEEPSDITNETLLPLLNLTEDFVPSMS